MGRRLRRTISWRGGKPSHSPREDIQHGIGSACWDANMYRGWVQTVVIFSISHSYLLIIALLMCKPFNPPSPIQHARKRRDVPIIRPTSSNHASPNIFLRIMPSFPVRIYSKGWCWGKYVGGFLVLCLKIDDSQKSHWPPEDCSRGILEEYKPARLDDIRTQRA